MASDHGTIPGGNQSGGIVVTTGTGTGGGCAEPLDSIGADGPLDSMGGGGGGGMSICGMSICGMSIGGGGGGGLGGGGMSICAAC